MTEHGSNGRLRLGFQEVKERWHRVANSLPAQRHIARDTEKYEIVAITGERTRRNETRGDRRLRQFAVPMSMRRVQIWGCVWTNLSQTSFMPQNDDSHRENDVENRK